jgi:hypothetical protein
MSYKDGSAKQTEDYCDRFNHLDAPLLLVRLLADPGFRPASRSRENGFVRLLTAFRREPSFIRSRTQHGAPALQFRD